MAPSWRGRGQAGEIRFQEREGEIVGGKGPRNCAFLSGRLIVGIANGEYQVGEAFEAGTLTILKGEGNMTFIAMREAKAQKGL